MQPSFSELVSFYYSTYSSSKLVMMYLVSTSDCIAVITAKMQLCQLETATNDINQINEVAKSNSIT